MNTPIPTTLSRHALGTLLVAVQAALMLALAVPAVPAFLAGDAPGAAWLLAAAGILLGLWAVSCNRPGNFNVRPTPHPSGQLVQHGPYRSIRHPMYTAVIACALAAATAAAVLWAWLAVLALVAVLAVKSVFEERWMCERHSAYAGYRQGTWRFLPGIF